MNFYYANAILNLVPNAQFSWQGEEWEGLEWLDSRPCPTKEEWEKEKERLIAYAPKKECKDQAKTLIAKYDFAVLPDRSKDIQNIDEIISYRDTLLSLIKNPIENPEFPNPPEVIWK